LLLFEQTKMHGIQKNKQTDRQTDRQAKFIYRWEPFYSLCLDERLFTIFDLDESLFTLFDFDESIFTLFDFDERLFTVFEFLFVYFSEKKFQSDEKYTFWYIDVE